MARFRVLTGKHREGGRTYKTGEVVDSKSDLLKLNRGSRKFDRVTKEDDEAAEKAKAEAPSTLDELEKMTKAELESFAADGGIDISGIRTKDQLIIAIREAMA